MEKVKIYSKFERFWHWTQMILISLLILTGFEVHNTFELFGYESAIRLHNSASWAFMIITVFSVFWTFVTGHIYQFIPSPKLVGAQVHYYLKGIFQKSPHPTLKTPENKLNPLQKIVYFVLMVILFPLQIISGLLYLFFHDTKDLPMLDNLESIAVIHTIGAFLMIAFLITHMYLITTGKTVSSNIKGMVSGYEEKEEH